MNTPFFYSTNYILDKTHFSECFSQSMTLDTSIKAYYRAIAVFISGILLIFSPIDGYVAWFILSLGVIEALGVHYKKSWWLMRQMLSKAAGNKVALTINEQGIFAKSRHVDSQTLWSDIKKITATDKGFLLQLSNSNSYLSNRCLSNDAKVFIEKKILQPMA